MEQHIKRRAKDFAVRDVRVILKENYLAEVEAIDGSENEKKINLKLAGEIVSYIWEK